jgi:hypothetical protein
MPQLRRPLGHLAFQGRVQLPQCLLRLLAVGDVVEARINLIWPVFARPEQGHGRDVDPAILPLSGVVHAHDDVPHFPTGPQRHHGRMLQTRKERTVFAQRVVLHTHRGLPQELGLALAQNPLGGRVHGEDPSVHTLIHDSLEHGFEQQPMVSLGLGQLLLGPLPLRILEEIALDLMQPAVLVELAYEVFHDVDRRAVAPPAPDLEAVDPLFPPQPLQQRRTLGGIEVQIHDVGPDGILGRGKSEHRGEGRIAQKNPPFRGADKIPRQVVLEELMEALLALPRLLRLCLEVFVGLLQGLLRPAAFHRVPDGPADHMAPAVLLNQIILDAQAHRLSRQTFVGGARQDDDRRLRRRMRQPLRGLYAAAVSQVQVQENHVERPPRQQREGRLQPLDMLDFELLERVIPERFT